MDPTPPEERTWTWMNYAALWWAYGFSTGVWTIGSSMVSAGLTAWQAVICVFIAHLLGALAIVFNSRFGATYHIGYPVFQRMSFGVFGSLFPVLLRCGTGIVWVGVQLYQGGKFTSVILRCIFGNGWKNIPNTIPKASEITVTDLGGTMIFWAITMPLLFMKVHNTRWLWTIKAFVLPPCVIGLFIYTQILYKSPGGTSFKTIKGYEGSALAWTMLKAVNSAMGKTSPSQVNQPDLARYAKTRNAPFYSQLLALPIANTAVACLGIFATSSTYAAWGTLIWNPWDLCSAILDRHFTSGVRFAIFLVSFAFTLSIFVSNQAANVIPFGADITALCPKILNINRGQFIAYCLGLCICPWYILNSATSFLTFLSGYSIFLGPIVGVSCADYFWRKGNVHVPSLYTGSKKGHYYYHFGVNWRAMLAFWLACIPTLPGFAGTFGHHLPAGAVHLLSVFPCESSDMNTYKSSYIGWLYSILTSSVIYIVLCIISPPDHMPEARQAEYEQWADEQEDLLDHRTGALPRHAGGDEEPVDAKIGHEVAAVVEEVKY
ncbi:uracil permease [Naematelia encephala]|uniref:Uracil permease n=1 Tax=Naematelia encephala TaxID=71784 RepID=A0A1Y2BMD3_9TREE|nr:uracil permease [Naematelia encephala]